MRRASDSLMMTALPSLPQIVDNRYHLEQLLGTGGMGAVYRARDTRLNRLVAIKVVRAELLGDVEAHNRFRREAHALARLQHPSIVAILDAGALPDGGAFLVMELVDGEDLRRVLTREGRLEPPRAAEILTSVCAAIEAAHREGTVHGDLKPENILLPRGGTEAKVLEFGVAKLMEGHTMAATPAYMAPEQFRGVACDPRTDVFSLGVIAYEMVCGELPFGQGTLADVLLAQSRGVPTIGGGLSPAVERAIRTALEPDADRRPATPLAFAHLVNSAV